MADNFFRYPHTPHLRWLAPESPREDKVMSDLDAAQFLTKKLTIEEKLDGANLGLSIVNCDEIQAQNRGSILEHTTGGQFKHLWKWIKAHKSSLIENLGDERILFGEWCYAQHSIYYKSLPDWFLGFDIYDQMEGKFMSSDRRDSFLSAMGISPVSRISRGVFSFSDLKSLLNESSTYGAKKIEGIYLRADDSSWLEQRAKLVRSDFTQTIQEHWSRRPLCPNQIKYS